MSDIREAIGDSFRPDEHEASTGDFEPLPAGWYPVQIDSAAVEQTKKKDGLVLKLQLTVVGASFANRKLFRRINIQNPSQQCQEIGIRELAGLGKACGLATLDDSAELLEKFIQVKVKVRADEGRDPDNQIIAFKAMDTSEPAQKKPTATEQTAAKPSTRKVNASDAPSTKTEPAPATAAKPAGKRPWER
jgi:hypothetical protein